MLLWLPIALAMDSFDYWELAHEAMLMESLDGDLDAARERYEDLVHNVLPSGDPSLATVLYRLGWVRYLLGDLNGARDALDACIRTGIRKARCLDLRSRIDLEADAVRSVPVHWTFDDPRHGFLHPRTYWDKGTIRIHTDPDGESVLEWQTRVDAIKEDMLVVGFREPSPPPRSIRLSLRSMSLDAMVRLEFEDLDGHRYQLAPHTVRVPEGQTVELRIQVADLAPLDPEAPALDPSNLHRLYLTDLTGLAGGAGPNVLRLDDFEVR